MKPCARLTAALLALAGAAQAQDRPVWPPTRDSTVTYKMLGVEPGEGRPTESKFTFSAALRKLRMDFGTQAYMIVDMKTQSTQMVIPAQRMVMTVAPGATETQAFDFSKLGNGTRKGTQTIAGISCTVWTVTMEGMVRDTCLTDEGVMLRSAGPGPGGKEIGLEATNIAYATVPDSAFAIPPGYQTMQMPGGAPGRPRP